MGAEACFSRVKAAAASSWPISSSADVKNGEATLHSPIHIHGVVLNQLSTETTSLLPHHAMEKYGGVEP
jgi:cobyrinic acid a,c-diamide synthase